MSSHQLIKVQDWQGPGQLWALDGPETNDLKPTNGPVLISHGTFSNADTCLPIAGFFGRLGPVYVIEWRARDLKRGNVSALNYYDVAEGEMVQAITYVSARHANKGLHVVGHSGGGLAMVLGLLHAPSIVPLVRSMTLLGAQATHANSAPMRARTFRWVMGRLGRHLGYWPVGMLGLGPCSEASGIMDNWTQWNRQRRFSDRHGQDVIAQLHTLEVPTLVLAGAADKGISPEAGCRAIADGFGPHAVFEICGRAQGYSEDFDHSRLFRSRAATHALWPRIADWIAQNRHQN